MSHYVQGDEYESVVMLGRGGAAVAGVFREKVVGAAGAWQLLVRELARGLGCTLTEDSLEQGMHVYRIACADWAQAKRLTKLLHETATNSRGASDLYKTPVAEPSRSAMDDNEPCQDFERICRRAAEFIAAHASENVSIVVLVHDSASRGNVATLVDGNDTRKGLALIRIAAGLKSEDAKEFKYYHRQKAAKDAN